jgi:hypothetical protein
MSKKPSIPRSGADFDVCFNNIVEYTLERVIAANPVWTRIPKPEAEAAVCTAWHAVYEKTLVPHSPVVTAEKNRVRTSSQKTLEDFTNRFLRHPPVTDEDRDSMGIHNPCPRRVEIPAPTTVPELSPRAGTPRQIVVPYRDKGSTRRGKPNDACGIKARWAILDGPPADIEDLIHSSFDTRSPLFLEFAEHERGSASTWRACGKSSVKESRAPPARSCQRLSPKCRRPFP